MPFDEGLTLARRPEGEERIRGARVDALFAQFRSGHSPLGSQPFFERPALSGVAGTQFAPQLLSTVTARGSASCEPWGERLAFGLAFGAAPTALRFIVLNPPAVPPRGIHAAGPLGCQRETGVRHPRRVAAQPHVAEPRWQYPHEQRRPPQHRCDWDRLPAATPPVAHLSCGH